MISLNNILKFTGCYTTVLIGYSLQETQTLQTQANNRGMEGENSWFTGHVEFQAFCRFFQSLSMTSTIIIYPDINAY